MKNYTKINNKNIPIISGAKGKGSAKIDENSLFSTDILFVTTALGEGPIYRINPNGPQDIQIQDNSIDDLVNLDGDGLSNTEKFKYISASGTITQSAIDVFGETIITPQTYSSSVSLKAGNLQGIPSSKVTMQETSARSWDSLKFNFVISSLFIATDTGDSTVHTITVRITIYDSLGITTIATRDKTITGKTESAFKFSETISIPEAYKVSAGYRFSVEKITNESDDSKIRDDISFIGWDEIENSKQAYPRTAVIGYALKAVDEYVGSAPNFTSWLKGLLVKVPSNYNQPILADGQIDWRELEVATSGANSYTTNGYRLQHTDTTILYTANPQIYIGTWDGSFIYSWTQNPVWIVYDLLTNKTYGLGIPEDYIDKYRFYQISMYCDACDSTNGTFIGVNGLADGTFRYKPLGLYTTNRENQIGLLKGTAIQERRFISDISITDQEQGMDILNKICSTFRSVLVYSGGKISLAIDMPEDYPVMLFNETNIKNGSLSISGIKESAIYTGIDISYIEPSNHFKRETIRINTLDSNSGNDKSTIENIASLDLVGVTRRSQAIRTAQYQIASSKYIRRNITFTASNDAINLTSGDVISVSTQTSGISYGYGGKVIAASLTGDANTNVTIEHFTVPGLTDTVFSANTYPLAMRIIKQDTDRVDLYVLSNTSYNLYSTGNVASGYDSAVVTPISIYNKISKSFDALSSFASNNTPTSGDLWSIGEVEDLNNFYTNKAGKLFKVTNLSRDPKTETIEVTGVEYISNVYTDSDTFIDYEPTSYTDVKSSMTAPPAPYITFTAVPRRTSDGSVVIDGVINDSTDKSVYGLSYETEYYVGYPEGTTLVSNITATNPTTVLVNNASALTANSSYVALSGKNGFTTELGVVPLYCNSISATSSTITLTVEGLASCFDYNTFTNILAANTIIGSSLSGSNKVIIPVTEKIDSASLINFVGYNSTTTNITRDITSYDLGTNTITIDNVLTNGVYLSDIMMVAPTYITIFQTLNNDYIANNNFFVKGTNRTFIVTGNVNTEEFTQIIELPVHIKSKNFIRFTVDGIAKTAGQYDLNTNIGSSLNSNIQYIINNSDVSYRAEIDYYTVPTIEIGDNIQISSGNIYSVTNSSYDYSAASYNVELYSNSIYSIELATAPIFIGSAPLIVNVSPNPIGILGNISTNQATFDYSSDSYYGSFNLANNKVYDLEISGIPEKTFLSTDRRIEELPIGITTLSARNKNTNGRTSAFVKKSITVSNIPIQKVENITIAESLYREQNAGSAVRVTCAFDHILNQEVTDYEISYKLEQIESVGSDDGGTSLTSYNTVKVPASGVDTDNKIRFTVSNINRGSASDSNSITFRVTPLNKNIRGVTATKSKSIVGKTAPPKNVYNFTGGQQSEQITLFWKYYRINDELEDIDLKEVVIRRALGTVSATVENFLNSAAFVTVSAGTARKSIPIDIYGTYTYLVRTRDTSGNFSDSVIGVTLTTSRPVSNIVIAAYNEDNPGETFTIIANDNSTEYYFPSFTNSATGGLSYPNGTEVDNANGTSVGFSAVGGELSDLLATESATYYTQIRNFGSNVSASVAIDIAGSQEIQTLYTDTHIEVLEGVSEVSADASIFIDEDFGGIGHILGYSNTNVPFPRYDSNNKTWMSGSSSDNVYGIWNNGQFVGDISNANSYALIAGLINANAIALGATFYANGEPTSSNTLANLTTGATYSLVNFTQYNDSGSLTTYEGDLGAISAQTFIRFSTEDDVYFANGNVDSSLFINGSVDDGFIPYEAGTQVFKQFQIKFVLTNSRPDEFDFTLDKFRYTINKEQTVYTTTVPYSAAPTTVEFANTSFLYRPSINYTILDRAGPESNTITVVTTAASNSDVSFNLFASDGTGEYLANSSANIMITAIGV